MSSYRERMDNGDGTYSHLVALTGRNVKYQRLMVNQPISANGSVSIVLNVGLGTRALHLLFKSNANAYMAIYSCDANGNPITAGSPIAATNNGGLIGAPLLYSEWGGNPYICIYVFDKSTAANVVNFIDAYWTTA